MDESFVQVVQVFFKNQARLKLFLVIEDTILYLSKFEGNSNIFWMAPFENS